MKLPRSMSMQPSVEAAGAQDNSVSTGKDCRRSFSFYKVPDSFIHLSILKLDGSAFEVEVSKDACVSEVKTKIEDIFSQKEECGDISWSLLWGHFCLSYNDHKLIDDNESLKTYGIKDGDQLCFIRHLSPNSKPIERSSAGSDAIEKFGSITDDKNGYHTVSSHDLDEEDFSYKKHEDSPKMGHLFRELFSWIFFHIPPGKVHDNPDM